MVMWKHCHEPYYSHQLKRVSGYQYIFPKMCQHLYWSTDRILRHAPMHAFTDVDVDIGIISWSSEVLPSCFHGTFCILKSKAWFFIGIIFQGFFVSELVKSKSVFSCALEDILIPFTYSTKNYFEINMFCDMA